MMKVVLFLVLKLCIYHFNSDDEYIHNLKLDKYEDINTKDFIYFNFSF